MTCSYDWKCDETVVSGLWKFNSGVSLEELKALAEEWKRHKCNNWLELYIRGVGKDGALGIGFRYMLEGVYDPDTAQMRRTPQQAKAEFFNKMTDQLKRQFGNNFVGWDISIPTWVLVVG